MAERSKKWIEENYNLIKIAKCQIIQYHKASKNRLAKARKAGKQIPHSELMSQVNQDVLDAKTEAANFAVVADPE